MNDPLRATDAVKTISESLAVWAELTPDAIALLSPGHEPITYRELHDEVERLAAELRAVGLGRQDGIALLLPEGPELCLALLAAISVGIAVPLAWPSPEAEHSRILANPRVRAVVVSGEAEPSVSGRVGTSVLTIATRVGWSGRIEDFQVRGQRVDGPIPNERPDEEDIALILHSSGTTGRPKLVPRLHRNSIATCRAIVEARALTRADRCLSLSRTAYSQGLIIFMTAVFSGASVITVSEPDPDALPMWLKMHRPTYISITPTVLRALATDRKELQDALREFPLRCILSSAGPLSDDELHDLESALGAPILNTYGMSEASFIAGEPFPELHRVPGSVGLARCEIQTIDESGEPLARHQTGEIVIRGPRVFPGYLDDPEATAATFLPGGWFRTGDVGFLDEAGYLHLIDRRGEVVNRGGEKIAPLEIDQALASHPAVADAAAFAVPDVRLGEDIVVAVVLVPGSRTAPRELRRWMLDRLSPSKVPRRIWMMDELPKTPTGKVQRRELARRWREEHR